MRNLFFIVPTLFMIPIGIYFYIFLRRMLRFIGIDVTKIYVKVCLAIVSFLFVYPATNIWGIWAVIVIHLFVFCMIVELLGLILKKMNKGERIFNRAYQLGIIPILCLLLILSYGYWNMRHVVEENYTISTTKNIQQNYRVVFVSDLHYPTSMNRSQLELYCRQIQKTQPDLVILGGDIVDENTTKSQMKEVFATLGNIQSEYGVYYVYGNHDQASYSSDPSYTVDELNLAINESQIHLLNDSSQVINNDFVIVGRNDARYGLTSGRLSSSELIKDIDLRQFILLIDHQPVELQENSQNGYDLQLSGHTHGGQIFPVGLVSNWLKFGELNYGYKKINDFQVIVSSGIAGYGYPLRTGSQSEYEIIDIVKK